MDIDIKNRLERIFKKINEEAGKEISIHTMNTEIKTLLLIKELIKEQVPNENTNSTTR